METEAIIALVVVAIVVLLIISTVVLILGRRRRNELQDRYGEEYDRTVGKDGRHKGESELSGREKRVADYEIHELTEAERERFANRWETVQAKFVDAPRTALQHADVLVQELMAARGYPVADFEQRAADLSVDHAGLVSDYRAAHATSQKVESATTEQLRQAMLHYRSLFNDLLKTDDRLRRDEARADGSVPV